MNVMVLSASMRPKAQSLKVAQYLTERLKRHEHNAWLLDLHTFKLPMFDDGETVAENKPELLRQLADADAYVFVSPEWDGMMSHGLVNMLHYPKHEMAYKPVMLVGVSAGRGGSHPLDQMKQLGPKNRHYIISPENLIISGVETLLNDFEMDETSADFPLKSRAEYSLKILVELAKALREVRESGTIDLKSFPNGV